MANDAFAARLGPQRGFVPQRTIERTTMASLGFIALLLLVFVGLTPFAPLPSPTAGAAQSAHGDALRQILYLLVLAPIGLAALQRLGFGAMRAIPFSIFVLLGWCLLSASWSAVPDVTLRRAALASIIVLAAMLSVETIGPERAFRLWRIVLVGILVVNWLSIPLIAAARHLPGEADPGLVGDWRGLYSQKNSAGAVCVMTVLLFLFSRNGRGNWIGWVVTAAALGFLVMTRSKTSIALLPVAVAAGGLYSLAWRDGLSRTIFLFSAVLLLAALAAVGLIGADAIAQKLEDPTQFTGRAEIWQASFAFLRDHALLGGGFGTAANTGGLSLLHNYVRDAWVENIADSHNGYLQILVTIGSIGLLLAMIALLLMPLIRFWPLEPRARTFKGLLFALFVFVILHNFMESDFLENDNGVWLTLLIVIASLRSTELAKPG